MRFKLPRQVIDEEINQIAFRAVKRQKIAIPRATKKNLKEIAEVLERIEKEGIPSYFVLKKLKQNLGSGIFLRPDAKPILKGTVIAPYSGLVSLAPQNEYSDSDYIFSLLSDLRLTKEEQHYLNPRGKFHPRRLYSLDLDALKQGNFTRFINHSEKPNIEAHLLRIPPHCLGLQQSQFEIIYICKKKISPGEQLLVCYEDDEKGYWGALKIKPFPLTPATFHINSSLQVVS